MTRRARWLVPVSLLAAATWLLFARLSTSPEFWFDEGYKANAARTLAELGRYATRSVDGLIPYDPGISGGPLDIAAMAFAFKLFGVTVLAARLPAALFGVLALVALYGIVARLHGPRSATIACLAVLAAPPLQGVSFVLLARQALAEVPALALLLCGLFVYLGAAPRASSTGGRAASLVAAGVLLGLAMLSRQQWALTFGPALLALVALRVDWRARDWRRHLRDECLPVVVMAATVVVWKATEYFGTPPELRAANVAMALDAARTNLLTGLWGRGLTRSAWAMVFAISSAVVMATGWLVMRRQALSADQRRFHLFVVTGLLAHVVWFAIFSVGWPRYAFPGLIFAIVSASVVVVDAYDALTQRRPAVMFGGWLAACALLGAGAMHASPPAPSKTPGAAARMAAVVLSLVPRNAVVETWEWEIGTLAGPQQFHFPHQRYLFEAIRMGSHHGRRIALAYDVLQRNPDYLIRGPFEGLAHVYDDARVAECFRAVAVIEPYTLFVRSGCR